MEHFSAIERYSGNSATHVPQFVGQLLHRQVIARVADVENSTVGTAVFVGNDLHQAIDAVLNVGKGTALMTAIHQLNRFTRQNIVEELGQHTGTAFLGGVNAVQLRADPVEGAEESKAEPLMFAVSIDNPVKHLFRARVDPAFLGDGSQHQRRIFLVELMVG